MKKQKFIKLLFHKQILMFVWVLCFLSCKGQKVDWLKVIELPQQFKEISGMAMIDGVLISHNDSGDGPNLYAFDVSQQKYLQKFKFKKANNTDWEDMAYHAGYVYIADTGNNGKTRKKMGIYRVKTDYLKGSKVKEDEYEFTSFKFRDKNLRNTRENVEAIAIKDSVITYISKSNSGKANIYQQRWGEEYADWKARIKIPFQVTGATTYNDKLYICGYEKISDTVYFAKVGKLIKSNASWEYQPLPITFTGQCESIFIKDGILYLATEKNPFTTSTLYLYNLD